MTMVRYVLTIGATAGLLFGGAGQAQAQAPEAPVATISATGTAPGDTADRTLTLDQALALARRSNRSLVVERAVVVQANVGLEQAYNVLFPTVSVQGKYTRNNIGVPFPSFFQNMTTTDMAADPAAPVPAAPAAGSSGPTKYLQPLNQLDGSASAQTLLFAPAVYSGLKAVKAGVAVAQENMKANEDSILFSVAQAFYAAAVADEVLVARDSNIAVAKATLDTARTRFAAGTVTKLDVDRAEIALLRAEQAKREAELGRSQSYRSLATLIEADGAFKVVPSALIFNGDEADALGKDLVRTLQLRPEFRALEAVAEQAELQRKADAWRWAPSISAFGNARVFNYYNFAQQQYSWAVGATLDWVIYDGGTRDSDRHLQIAKVTEAMARQQVLRESIRDDIENGKLQVRTKHQAQLTAERSVGLAQESVELTRTQYEAGSATQIDVLQAQDALVAAQDELARAHFDVALADLTLRRAAGTFPEQR